MLGTFYIKVNRLENFSTFEVYSIPAALKATIYVYNKLVVISVYTYKIETLEYGKSYTVNLPSQINCKNESAAIIGNNGSSGQLTLVNNVIKVESTLNTNPLKNTFMGQLITFLKN
nr:MAG TPA: hypothetical protein [Caudoviricetes sp.]